MGYGVENGRDNTSVESNGIFVVGLLISVTYSNTSCNNAGERPLHCKALDVGSRQRGCEVKSCVKIDTLKSEKEEFDNHDKSD